MIGGSLDDVKLSFCIWILLKDGLQVQPFSLHHDGDHSLRDLGLDRESWWQWFYKVLVCQDGRLGGCKNEAEKEIRLAQRLKSQRDTYERIRKSGVKKMRVHNPETGELDLQDVIFDEAVERKKISDQLTLEIERYQEAARLAAPFGSRDSPPKIWQGSPLIKQYLKELWTEFCPDYERQASQRFRQEVQKRMNRRPPPTDLISRVKSYPSRRVRVFLYRSLYREIRKKISCLRVFTIEYPAPVLLAVPPDVVISSFRVYNGLNRTYRQYRLIKKLVRTLCNSSEPTPVAWNYRDPL